MPLLFALKCCWLETGTRAAARYRNGNGRNDGWLIHFVISPQFHRYTGEFRLGFPLSYGLLPISAYLRRLRRNNRLKLVVELRQSTSEFAGQRNQRSLLPKLNESQNNNHCGLSRKRVGVKDHSDGRKQPSISDRCPEKQRVFVHFPWNI
jgi:hypothetical protein